MNASSDHNLLFGVLALHVGFVTQQQLAEAMAAWRLEKSTPLGEILRRRGLIDDDDCADVEKLLAKHVKKHGDVTASLAALPAAFDLPMTSLDAGARQVSLSPPTAPPSNDASPPTLLPGHEAPAAQLLRPGGPMRYVRLRTHARGGLGEVFVALDEELGREVALKEIQDRFADHPDSRARFVREAELTGSLEHPGVVPVYGLGAYADGRPFYAMRFIHGESMHEAIKCFHEADKGKRHPGERSLAMRELLNRFVAVCDAVAYAHNHGVIHRDLKPANVMLGGYGETLVVDWGLARQHNQDDPQAPISAAPVALSGGSGTATQLGQAVGTPAFMAPEQARGEQDRVGPASDVFSLGATLYELLTGAPPYAGLTAAEVLALACEGKVVPARQRKTNVPRPLEAVCARAMAAAPENRYANAARLGDEVRRWLADEPVEAYREPPLDRARRWGRRHRTVVSVGVALLAAGVVALGLGLWFVNEEKAQTERQRDRAIDAEARERDRATEAEENLKLARQAIDEVFVVTKDDPAFQQPRMEKAKQTLLTKTLPFYKRFRARQPDDPELQRQEAEQWYRVGEIEASLGHASEAIKAFEQSRDVRLALLASAPDPARDETALAATHNFLSTLFMDLGRYREAGEESEKARLIRTRLAAAGDAEARSRLTVTLDNLGLLLKALGQYKKARKEHEEAKTIRADLVKTHPGVTGYARGLARTHNNLGVLLVALGDWPAALREYDEAERLQLDLIKAHPNDPQHRVALARTCFNRAGLHRAARRPDDARREYQKAHDLQARVVADNPDVPHYRKLLALILSNWGTFLRETDNLDDAGKRCDAAFAIREKLTHDHPELPEFESDLAASCNDLAELAFRHSNFDEGVNRHQQARTILARLTKQYPNVPAFRSRFADTCNALGNRLNRRGRQKEALHEYRQARDVWQKLTEEQPEVPAHRADLSVACVNLGALLGEMKAYADAGTEFRRVLELRTRLANEQPGVAGHPRFLADAHFQWAEVLLAQGEPANARDQLDQAHRLQTDLLKTQSGGVEDKVALARTCLRRGELKADRKYLPQCLADLDQVILLAGQVRQVQPNHPQLADLLRLGTTSRAEVLDGLGKPEQADSEWERALKLTPLGERGNVRVQRAISRARCGDDRRAAAEAAELARRINVNAETLCKLACVQALNTGHAARQSSAPLAEREKRAEGYAKEALALLRRAADAGFFRQPKNAARLLKDEDLAGLRGRADFQAFLKTLKDVR